MAGDPYQVIAGTCVAETELGGSVAMRVLSALDAAGLIVVQKPNYSIDGHPGDDLGSGEAGANAMQSVKAKPALSIVRD